MPKVLLATDHAGFELKEKLKSYIESLGHEIKDFGAHEYNRDDDFTDFIIPLAKEISKDANLKGIILGGSGQGEAMVANKFKNVRAIVYYGPTSQSSDGANAPLSIINLSRQHNDANILSLGARFLSDNEAKRAVKSWLETPFSGDERHVRRLEKVNRQGESVN